MLLHMPVKSIKNLLLFIYVMAYFSKPSKGKDIIMEIRFMSVPRVFD